MPQASVDQNITFKKGDFFNNNKMGIGSSSIMFYDSRALSNFFLVKSHALCSHLFTDYMLRKKGPFALYGVLDLPEPQRTIYLSSQIPCATWFQCGDETKTLVFQPFLAHGH